MSKLEVALSAWFAFHTKLGVNIEATLMPPATEQQIQAAESRIGFRLPDDLRELYLIANGQYEPRDHDNELVERLETNEPWAPLFGYYTLLPLDRAVSRYVSEQESYKSEQEFNQKYYAANPQLTYTPDLWDVREGDPVEPNRWNASWFVFAEGNADNYAVDMSPPRGGFAGQVIEYGADVARLSVVATSLTDLFEQAAYQLDPQEENRYQRSPATDGDRASVYFDMDWRNKPYSEQEYLDSIPQMPAEYTAWIEQISQQRELQREQFKAWLKTQGLSAQTAEDVINAGLFETGIPMELADPPPQVIQALEALMLSQGETPTQPNDSQPGAAEIEQAAWLRYAMQLASNVIDSQTDWGKYLSDRPGGSVLRTDAISLGHQYKLETGEWTQADFDMAEKLKRRFENLEVNKLGIDRTFFIDFEGTVLKVCHSTFDEKTYKREEHCEEVDVASYRQ